MKILIISFNYAPLVNPRVLRWQSLCEYWAELGHEVYVVSTSVSGSSSEEKLNGVCVYRVGRSNSATKAGVKSGSSSIKELIRPIYNRTFKKLIWPDSNYSWARPASEKAEEVYNKVKPDHVLSISHPFVSHWAAWKFMNKINFQVKWSMDSGDPFAFIDDVEINNRAIYGRKNFRVEGEMLDKAHISFVTTKETKSKYEKHFPGSGQKTKVIPPLLRTPVRPIEEKAIGAFRWLYCGTLYKKIRNPGELLSVFNQYLIDVDSSAELHFYGAINDCWEEFDKYEKLKNKNIFIHGLVSPQEVALAQKKSDILINIGNRTSYQLPSKIIEYMATGKPIINFCSVRNDSSSQLLKLYPLAVNQLIGESSVDLLKQLAQWSEKCPPVEKEQLEELLKPFSLESLSSLYLEGLSLER